MKRSIYPLIAGVALLLLGADKPKKFWDLDWNRKSFCTTINVLTIQAKEDGNVTDEELIGIAKAGFRILEPEDKKAQLIAKIGSEANMRVVSVAHVYERATLGYDFYFSKDGHFEKLVIVPDF